MFDLAENEDLSPLETDPEKLAHKYKEVRREALWSVTTPMEPRLTPVCLLQLQIKHAVTQAEIQQLKRKVS